MSHEINRELLKKIADLAKLSCSNEELDSVVQHLKNIVSHAEALNEIETDDVPACNNVLENFTLTLRDDIPEETLDRDTFLRECPDHIGGMVRVPPVLKS